MNYGVSSGLMVAAIWSWVSPGFNGFFFSATPMTEAEGHIMASVLFVGAILAFLMPKKDFD